MKLKINENNNYRYTLSKNNEESKEEKYSNYYEDKYADDDKRKNKRNNKRKKKKEKRKINKTVQQSIPYVCVYENSGIIETEEGTFTKSYLLQDINYQIAKQEDRESIFINFGEFLNSFDSSINIQVTINNKNIDIDDFEKNAYLQYKKDDLDEYRKEYNSIFNKSFLERKNNMTREKYLTISLEAESFEAANSIFNRLDSEISSSIRKINQANIIQLSTEKRLEILHDIYNMKEEKTFDIDFKTLKKRGLTTKDYIAPDFLEFKGNYMKIGDKYARALFLSKISTFLSDKFIYELTNIDINMLTSIHYETVNQSAAIKMIEKHIFNIEANISDRERKKQSEGVGTISTKMIKALEDAEEWRTALTKLNQKMFFVSLIVVHFADSIEELNNDTETIMSKARTFMCEIKKLSLQQEDAFNSALPLCNNKILINRTMTTESASLFIPYSSQELFSKGGLYYGVNTVSKNIILYDRRLAKNSNGFILGSSGAGKSFFAKREMINVILNTDDDVIVIDPEREYAPLSNLLKGEVIKISPGSDTYVNALDLDIDYADNDNPISLKSEFLLSFFEIILGGVQGLNPVHKSIIDRVTILTYREYVNKNFDKNYIPTLCDFQKLLESQSEVEARELAVALELYTRGSLDIFAHKTNVLDSEKRFIIYDTKDMGKNVKTLSMLIILDSVWNRIIKNRKIGKRTWLYIDEIYLLFNNEISASYLQSIYKRARKWDAVPTGLTQNVEDILRVDVARTMLSNSEFIVLLNQAALDRVELAKLLNISNTQLSYITNAAAGEGLICVEDSIIPFTDNFPKNTKLYQAMTTKSSEMQDIYR